MDQGTPRRSSSQRLFDLMHLAISSIAMKLHLEDLPEDAAKEVRAWLARFIDLGRETEREKTLEMQRRAEAAEHKLTAAQAQNGRLRSLLKERGGDPR